MRVLGLSSGTSHDAIDAAVVDLRADGPVLEGELRYHARTPYPDELRAELVAALPPRPASLAAVCRLDTDIGRSFAAALACPV
jgi:anhydro-N-acetylmuramic acid kinase